MIVSIVMTAKKKKKFVAGIISGIVLIIAGLVFVVFGLLNAMLAGVKAVVEIIPTHTSFTPAEGSSPISGTLKIDGNEVAMPCTVTELQNLGYDTDYEWFNQNIYMWPTDNKNGRFETPHFQAYIDNSYGYDSNDHVKGSDQISAIKIQRECDITFEFGDLQYGMSKDAFIEMYGAPAYEIDHPTQGDFLYYVGENDTIYRFAFDHNYTLFGIMYGTSEYMEYEMNGLYH